MSSNNIEIYKVKDPKEKYYTNKKECFDLPMRILLIGKSQYSGKSSYIVNLLCQNNDKLYKKNFTDIYIFSGSIKTDNKIKTIINQFDIPEENCYEKFDDEVLDAIYEFTEEQYNYSIENNEKVPNTLVILDDIAFDGSLKNKVNGSINKCFCNGRHINLSICVMSQKYSMCSTTQRENATGLVIWNCTDKQLDLISDDHNMFDDKKTFKKMFRKVSEKPHTALIINYSNTKDKMYQNMNFEIIGPCGNVKGKGCNCK